MVIDPNALLNDTLSIETILLSDSENAIPNYSMPAKWFGGALGPDGYIYSIPNNYNAILIIKPLSGNNNLELLSYAGYSGTESNKWRGAIVTSDNTIVGIPYNADAVLRINISPKNSFSDATVQSRFFNKL